MLGFMGDDDSCRDGPWTLEWLATRQQDEFKEDPSLRLFPFSQL
jgi:hypothetical protein